MGVGLRLILGRRGLIRRRRLVGRELLVLRRLVLRRRRGSRLHVIVDHCVNRLQQRGRRALFVADGQCDLLDYE